MRTVSIYALVDPRNGAIRYVGQTIQRRPTSRLNQHCFVRDCSPKSQWVDELKRDGHRPKLQILQTVQEQHAVEAERNWIETLKADGIDLLNVYDPDLTRGRPELSKAKQAESMKQHRGWRHSLETRAKIGRQGAENSQAKLCDEDVRSIRAAVAAGRSQASVARSFGVCAQTVCDIMRGRKWAHVQ